MADHNARASDPINLNIGGERMLTTTRGTLSHGDSMLTAMFSGRHKIHTDEQVRRLGCACFLLPFVSCMKEMVRR